MGSCNSIYSSLSGQSSACVNDTSNVQQSPGDKQDYSGIQFPYTLIYGIAPQTLGKEPYSVTKAIFLKITFILVMLYQKTALF